jgi:hypothetical protein
MCQTSGAAATYYYLRALAAPDSRYLQKYFNIVQVKQAAFQGGFFVGEICANI